MFSSLIDMHRMNFVQIIINTSEQLYYKNCQIVEWSSNNIKELFFIIMKIMSRVKTTTPILLYYIYIYI